MELNSQCLQMSSAERVALKCLCENIWKAFYTSEESISSKFLFQEETPASTYPVLLLTIDCGRKIRIRAVAVDIAHKEEVFRIVVEEDLDFGLPLKFWGYRPSSQLLKQYPGDLELHSFLHTPISVEVIQSPYTTDSGIALTCDKGLLFQTPDAKRLLIYADDFVPLHIKATTLETSIDELLNEFSSEQNL